MHANALNDTPFHTHASLYLVWRVQPREWHSGRTIVIFFVSVLAQQSLFNNFSYHENILMPQMSFIKLPYIKSGHFFIT